MIGIKTKEEIGLMVKACSIVSETLSHLEQYIKPGIETIELDNIAEDYIRGRNAIPGFKGLYGFPATLCISVEDEVVHGIPKNRVLSEGNIVGVDVGAIVDGYYGDHARTFEVGNVSEEKKQLMEVTKKSLELGIEACCPGNRIGDIGFVIQKYAEDYGYGVVRELVGHGIGKALHEEPQIPNFGDKDTGAVIKEGMCFAIEPMINLGTEKIYTKSDQWTICTQDGLPSAHFEHTIVVTSDGSKILTQYN
jgi:methionyl aminopeptidase